MQRQTNRRTLLILIVLALALVSLHRFYEVISEDLIVPYDLAIESHNLATIRSLKCGQPIYDREFFEDLPFIITIYNPLYFLFVSILPQNASNPFFTGRLVSLFSAVLVLLLLFFPGQQNKRRHIWIIPLLTPLLAPLLAIVWLLTLPIFVKGAVYLHPDLLGLLLAGTAIVILEKSIRAPHVIASSFLAFLAFATKQNFVCALWASFIFLVFLDRRKAFLYAISSAVFLGSFLLIVPKILGSGYWFSTFLSVLKHPSFLTLTMQRLLELFHQPMFGLLVASVVFSMAYVALKHREIFTNNPYLIYLEITAVVPLLALGKIGGEPNYCLEFVLASLLWLVFFAKRFMSKLSQRHIFSFLACFLIFFLLDFSLTDQSGYFFTKLSFNHYFQSNFAEKTKEEIKALHPRDNNFLVINTQVLCPLFKKNYFNDPYNYWLMWNYRIIKPDSMIRAIKTKYFSVIMYASEDNPYHIPAMNPIPATRSTANILRAINENYQLSKIGTVSYYTPRP